MQTLYNTSTRSITVQYTALVQLYVRAFRAWLVKLSKRSCDNEDGYMYMLHGCAHYICQRA